MKQAIRAEAGVTPRGPYSHGVIVTGPTLYVAAQGPIDPVTDQPITGDISAQAERVFANIQIIVEAAGATMADVAKVTVYLKDWALFGEMNEVYNRFFPAPYPARTTAQSDMRGQGLILADVIVAIPEK